MSKALLVVNYGNCLCENSRQSMQAAADRWGATYWELNETTQEKLPISPACMKCAAFELSNYDEVITLDADMVVSSKAPSPFFGPMFFPETLVVVHNGSEERFFDIQQIRSCERFEWEKLLGQEPRLAGVEYVPGTYFNTGMMVANRRWHSGMFKLALDVCHVDHGCGWNDQTPLNMAAKKLGVPLCFVDEKWNYIHPEGLPGFPIMQEGFLWHWAGSPGREHVMPMVVWKT